MKSLSYAPTYQPTFTVTEKRSIRERMTPLAWFCISLFGLGCAAAISIAVNLATTPVI